MINVMQIILTLCDIYVMLIFVYVLMSWLPSKGGIIGDIYDVLGMLCEPYLGLFRRIMPPVGGGGVAIDFSPLVAIIVLQLVVRLLYRLF